jgi:DNA-binding PadR family transcriptional regulator
MKQVEKKQVDLIGHFEQLVLAAIVVLGERAYGLAIHERVAELSKRAVGVGAVYTTLKRMEEKGYLTSRVVKVTSGRARQTRRVYTLREHGAIVLHESLERARRVIDSAERSWRLAKRKPPRVKT